MGNASSSEGSSQRPPLQSKISSSSTHTITPGNAGGNAHPVRQDLGARRRSLDLPDVYAKDLAFTSASPPSPIDAVDGSSGRWPRRSNTRGRGTPTPGKSAKAGPTVSNTVAAGVSSSSSAIPPLAAPVSSPATPISTVVQPQAPHESISMLLDAAESQAAALAESQTGSTEGLTPTLLNAGTPVTAPTPDLDALSLSPSNVHNNQSTAFPILPVLAPSSSSITSGSLGVMQTPVHPPLTPPVETVVAPFVPASIAPLPLGSGASQTTSLIIGQPLPLASRTRTPSNDNPMPPSPISPVAPTHLDVVPEAEAAGGDVPVALPVSAFPLPADYGASPPKKTVLPAAAPIAAASTQLANDEKAQAAVLNATVDLDAGPDAVPTLLTWRPSETPEGAGEGVVPGQAGPPKSVYVTGTFAKGWTTKIEMRKKKSASEFTAIVALPPGQHQLKFIVDKQWTTSRNLPSATDPDGNLINYLLVRGPQHQPVYPLGYLPEESDDDAGMWGTDIPPPIQQLGTDLDNFEAEERKYKVGQGPPPEYPYRYQLLQKIVPPSLPAPLKDVPLNRALIVAQGSGDDNSILTKPDHSILDHLCASPISKGLLSVAVTKRYRRKFVTTILYKPIAP